MDKFEVYFGPQMPAIFVLWLMYLTKRNKGLFLCYFKNMILWQFAKLYMCNYLLSLNYQYYITFSNYFKLKNNYSSLNEVIKK